MKKNVQHVRAVSFDLDGTLAVAGWRAFTLLPSLLKDGRVLHALLRSVAAHRGQRSRDLDSALIADVVSHTGASPQQVRRVLETILDGQYARIQRSAPAAPGVLSLMSTCDQLSIPRVIFSDHPVLEKLRGALHESGWTAVICARHLGALKPCPDGLWCAASILGVPASKILHVGDRWETDGLAAAAAGAQFAHVMEAEWWQRVLQGYRGEI